MTTTIHAPASTNGHDAKAPKPSEAQELRLQELERQGARRDGWMLFMYVFSAMALLTAIFGAGLGVRAMQESKRNVKAAAAGGAASVATTVHLSDFAIEPSVVNAKAGGTLKVMNMGKVAHNVAIEGQNFRSEMIDPGSSGRLSLAGLAPGDYTLFCEVSGHREAGMKAQLHLAAVGGTTTASATAGGRAATGHTMTADEMDAKMATATRAFPAKTAGLGAQVLAPTVMADGTKQFELTSSVVKWEVEPGRLVDAWTYNGTVPAPTIHVSPGDKVKVILHNQLPESTVIHFHGIETPNAMDGVPDITQPPVKAGSTFTYSFTAQSTPAVGMYHSHHDAAKQVANGMAGAFLIGEEPVPAGVTVTQEHVMMLNDSGTIGFSLNGKSFPATAPVVARLGEWVEVHYMNEGVMAHPMHLHGLAQLVIAKDGFALPQSYQADTVTVAPGERYTVLVHATSPGTWAWHCHILPHAERDDGMFGMVTAMVVT